MVARRAPAGVLRWPVPTVAVGALALAFVVIRPDTPTPGGGQPVASASAPATAGARQLLLAAAELTERAEATSGQYWVSRTETGVVYQVGPVGGQYGVSGRTRMETWRAPRRRPTGTGPVYQWLGAEPATPTDRQAWLKDGSPTSWLRSLPGAGSPGPGPNGSG